MKSTLVGLAVALMIGPLSTVARAIPYTFTEIDGPGSSNTQVLGINDFGSMTGAYVNGSGTHGFLLTGNGFISFDYPGASETKGAGISGPGSAIVDVVNSQGLRQSYLLVNAFTVPLTFFGPITVPGATRVDAFGISPNGQNVAGTTFSQSSVAGFARQGGIISAGSLSTISAAGTSTTAGFGINDSGTVVGYYLNGSRQQSFAWQAGTLTNINPQVAGFPDTQTAALGINNNGTIVGILANQRKGYIDWGGQFSLIDVPLPNVNTVPDGINDSGQIVGQFQDSSGFHGFLLTPFGTSQSGPILPRTILSTGACPRIFTIGNPLQCYGFTAAPTRAWFDPASASGYAYEMTGNSLFTGILDFPTGFASPFVVTTEGCSTPGTFGPGMSVDFVALCGHGVSSFEITGIDPLFDATNAQAFPIELAFNTPVADFIAEPFSSAPEPPTCLIIVIGLGAMALARQRRAPVERVLRRHRPI